MFEKNFTQKDLDDIDSELKELEPILSCYCSKNKEQKQNRLKRLLFEEKDIVTQSIKSTDIKERKELYLKFLEKENMLYDEYDNLPEKCSIDKEINIKHNLNSMMYYLQIFTKKLFVNKVFSAIGFAFLGAIFCFPYFFGIQKVPEMSIGSIPLTLVILSIVGIFITGVLFFYIFLQNFFLFNSWHKSKTWLKAMFVLVDLIVITLMALAPYIYVYFEINQDINIIMNWSMFLFILLLSIFSIIFWRSNRSEKDSIVNIFMAFAMIVVFDLIILLIIYFSYGGDYIIVVGFIVVFYILSRCLQIYNKFSYNSTMFIASIIVFALFIGYSQFLVRVVGIANYQTDFVINKKHIPSYIIDLNITKCSDISHKDDENIFDKYTCVLEEKDDNVLFKDILVKVKSDGRYWLEVVYRKDNRTKTKNFWVSEKNIMN